MATAAITREEKIGLAVAAAAHVAIVAVLLYQGTTTPAKPVVEEPERMVVSLATDVGLTSTAPNPVPQARRAAAPDAQPDLAPIPPAFQAPDVLPQPRPRPTAAPRPTTRATSAPRSTPAPAPRPTRSSSPAPTPRATRSSAPAPTPAPRPTQTRSGGISGDFLDGSGASASGSAGSPAATAGPREQAAIGAAIQRQLRPHWQAPNGVDAELLVTNVRFRLNRDGSLSGSPSCVSQSGVNDANNAQKDVHCERAIRAVRAAAPFNLPEQFYDAWRTVTSRFDRRL